ncbi:hypothetical protein BpHYR1_051126 [Brachionus plicatilis]|uniref:Uncharacterized protein n=1 Tax=Brachionus plicatilis TaxID=10195 RepID=A0A3M7PHT0_BRAPC|nr:hypothetical protein BpHYR1_051126 [Brachionus plicatilis]
MHGNIPVDKFKEISMHLTTIDVFLVRRLRKHACLKYLLYRKWFSKPKTLDVLYISLIGLILDYSSPCLNSFSETYTKKYQLSKIQQFDRI